MLKDFLFLMALMGSLVLAGICGTKLLQKHEHKQEFRDYTKPTRENNF
jgi:hypothetical protein